MAYGNIIMAASCNKNQHDYEKVIMYYFAVYRPNRV